MSSFVITGGPGSGKTTLIEALADAGYQTFPEVSRALIRQQVLNQSHCLPWTDLTCFARKCLDKMAADFAHAQAESTVFFDRGVPDILAYLKTGGQAVGAEFKRAAEKCRYETKVFVAPPWEEIYINDDERWQTFAESCDLYNNILQIYEQQGYEVIALPRASVQQRVDFVINTLMECVQE